MLAVEGEVFNGSREPALARTFPACRHRELGGFSVAIGFTSVRSRHPRHDRSRLSGGPGEQFLHADAVGADHGGLLPALRRKPESRHMQRCVLSAAARARVF
jgi:hypothetical protein